MKHSVVLYNPKSYCRKVNEKFSSYFGMRWDIDGVLFAETFHSWKVIDVERAMSDLFSIITPMVLALEGEVEIQLHD